MDINKVEKKLKLSPRTRDFGWYRSLFAKDRLRIGGEKLTDDIFEQFRLAVKATEEIYPGLWDIDFRLDVGSWVMEEKVKVSILGIVIKLPEVKITNSKRNSHDIKDLFIKTQLRIRDNAGIKKLYLDRLEGGRMSLTYAEYNSKYFHSHLPRKSVESNFESPGYQTFCTGSGDINISISDINSQGFTFDRYINYLLNISTLASWESLEGVPYVKITSINSFRQGATEYRYNSNNKDLYINYIKRHVAETEWVRLPVNFKLEKSGVSLIDDEALKGLFREVYVPEGDKTRFWVYKCTENEGVYYLYGQNISNGSVPTVRSKYIFQGVEVSMHIDRAPETITQIEYEFHPTVKQEIIKHLEYEANKAIIRKSTIDRYKDTTSNVGENIEPSPVPVPTDS